MSDSLQTLGAHQLRLIHGLCEELEGEIVDGRPPVLDPYLRRVDPGLSSALLAELVLTANDLLDPDDASDQLLACNPSHSEEIAALLRSQRGSSGGLEPAVRRLRVRCPSCGSRIDVPEHSELRQLTCSDCTATVDLFVATPANAEGDRVGDFVLEGHLGTGSFGAVWLAWDTRLGRRVALKFPHEAGLDASRRAAFLREARTAAQLNHPHIVAIHEIDTLGSSFFIVSEFVEGQTLADILKDGKPSARRAAGIIRTVAQALHYAHERGVVHRDVTPRNILIDVESQPHVTDFGLARWDACQFSMTTEGQVLGSPGYMSPEQASGRSQDADRRSDVYSLGVLLFEMLTGVTPFRGSIEAQLHQAANEDAPRPRSLAPSIPKDLETICLKCLERDPNRRYQTADKIADELDRYLAGRPIHARPITSVERLRRLCVRNPLPAAALFALIAVSIASSVIFGVQWRRVVSAQDGRARAQLEALVSSTPFVALSQVVTLESAIPTVEQDLRSRLSVTDIPPSHELRLRCLLLSRDRSQAQAVIELALQSTIGDVLVASRSLRRHRHDACGAVERLLEDSACSGRRRRHALLLLAGLSDSGEELEPAAAEVLAAACKEVEDNPRAYAVVAELLRPNAGRITRLLVDYFRGNSDDLSAKRLGTNLLVEYVPAVSESRTVDAAPNDVVDLVSLLPLSEPWQAQTLAEAIPSDARDRAAGRLLESLRRNSPPRSADVSARTASTCLGLLLIDRGESCWEALGQGDEIVRSEFVKRCDACQGVYRQIVGRLERDAPAGLLRVLLLCLGGASDATPDRKTLGRLTKLARRHPSPGVHAAALWAHGRLAAAAGVSSSAGDDQKPTERDQVGRQWCVNVLGQSMTMLGPGEFTMGGASGEEGSLPIPTPPHLRRVNSGFAIAQRETTVGDYRALIDDEIERRQRASDTHPISSVSWMQAALYCNRLSEAAGIAQEQWCYEENAETGEITARQRATSLLGYRLPTEWEWEYACRAGVKAPRFFGGNETLLVDYAWCPANTARGRKGSVAQLRPSPNGLFDIFGNATEWCHNGFFPYPGDRQRAANVEDVRMLRGSAAGDVFGFNATIRDMAPRTLPGMPAVGFRVCRTLTEEELETAGWTSADAVEN